MGRATPAREQGHLERRPRLVGPAGVSAATVALSTRIFWPSCSKRGGWASGVTARE